ncbi:MAG: hypothetical protein KME29_31730 [Calothrix sp. FI2-JRJ7]|nr:hypothetical protein [Calothrix sp. FI2-JRJ7]
MMTQLETFVNSYKHYLTFGRLYQLPLKDCEVCWIKAQSSPRGHSLVADFAPTPEQKVSLFEIPNNLDGEPLSKEDVEKLIE